MQSLTDEEIRDMSLKDAEQYTDIHPEEAWRFAKLYSQSALKQSVKRAKAGLKNE